MVPDPGRLLGLVVPEGVEGEFADEGSLFGEDAHVPVSNEKAYGLVLKGAADADVEQAAHIAQGDLALGVDPALSHAAMVGTLGPGVGCALSRALKATSGVSPWEGRMGPVVVVIGTEGVELQVEDGE
jgi:hypothetical protein